MAGNQFGFQPGELLKIQRDFEQINQRMEEMSGQLGHIKATVAKAAATDVFSGWIMGVLGAGKILAEVTRDVHEISARAEALARTKEKLTKELGEDAAKIKKLIADYEAVERKIAEDLKRKHDGGQAQPTSPKSPSTGIDGAGGGRGGGGTGGGGGGGGGHAGQPSSPHHGGTDTSGNDGTGVISGPGGKHDGPKLKDRSTGDWKTKIVNGNSWDAWSDHRHPRNGEGVGVKAEPKLDGVSDERRAMVERAMERVQRRLGYSQGAVTNGYRVDCSGFVSAAWGLPGPGTTTGPLISESSGIAHHIARSDLQPGDALVVDNRREQHVVLFGGWADAAHTRAIILEDSGSQGCISHEVQMSKLSEYTPIRKNGM
ncbi:hypothetical protein Kpho02_07650 [Kitasatospora phosalacinea]|uniref:NlpC/P60 domain-containing protein n=1 Tax=Kitasatospora phosalacinea TaxID=2065 RepID=A0A9W6Q4Q0_9ACTN|nr:hypothetical protein [Kitasatospora phosalacinea]GLW68466.1 hypothetical protein Kpho02_07650 [Kitasatospora phosalacinea]